MTLLTAPCPPLFDAAPVREPVASLEHGLRVEVGSQDPIALRVEVGVCAEVDGLSLKERERLEERRAGAADADLADAPDSTTVERDIPLGAPARVELRQGDSEAGIHAPIVTLATRRARGARVKALWEDGVSIPAIAVRVGLSQRQVNRWLNHFFGDDWKPTRPPVTDTARARIIELLRAEVPVGWVAETVDVSSRTVRDVRDRAGLPKDREWKNTRLQIQHDPALFALHQEFAPVRLRRS